MLEAPGLGPELTANAPAAPTSSRAPPGRTHGKVRDKVLAVEAFDSLLAAKTVIEDWRNTHDTRRPHSSLGWKTPAAHAADWKGH